jgi:DNA-binding NtrC family response regulator
MAELTARILVIDDERSVCLTCKRVLETAGHRVDTALSGGEGVRLAADGDHDLVLLDLKMPDMSGMEVLDAIKRERPELVVIIITGYATIQTSIEAIKKGAFNYVPKPFTPEELLVAVGTALESQQVRRENAYLRGELSRLKDQSEILGRSKIMEDLRRQILKIAASQFTVTVYGESGTGKELIARAVHEHSPRAAGPFISVDISALSPSLLESELFGHVKGAFTGATQSRPGYILAADGGTLFLDEISNMSLEAQGKLLRVLESRELRPVGSELVHKVDVRVIAATNRDLYLLVESGAFREDLYYRLNVIPVTVPPLRERGDDVPLLAMHFLRAATAAGEGQARSFTTAAMAKLMAHQWPGNVRELKNIVARLVATVDAELVDVRHLPPEIAGEAGDALDLDAVPRTTEELKEAKRRLKEMVYERVEREFVVEALRRGGGNVTRAAELVGMQRTNLHALMRRYGIRRDGADFS